MPLSAKRLHGNPRAGIVEAEPKPDRFFSPEVMAGEGIR